MTTDSSTNCPLGFYVDIPDQNYKVGRNRQRNATRMPLYGIGDLSYDLTPIPDGLRFDDRCTLMLAGTPTAAMTTVTLTYRVIDNGAVRRCRPPPS